jgi:hypothetical protein
MLPKLSEPLTEVYYHQAGGAYVIQVGREAIIDDVAIK